MQCGSKWWEKKVRKGEEVKKNESGVHQDPPGNAEKILQNNDKLMETKKAYMTPK